MKIFLIDGNSYIYRGYYAIRGLTTSSGRPSNAIFGFTNMLIKIIKDNAPDGMAIAMDSREPTKRHEAYEHYKSHRPETPDDLVDQIPTIMEIIRAFRIPVYEIPGYEADDILAAAARMLSADDNEIYIVAADKDMLQVIDDRIKVYDPIKDMVIDSEQVKDKFGVPPARIPEVMALMGDPVDNIPGAKGIGPKTARELLSKVKSLDELIENPSLAGKDRWEKMIKENKEDIILSHDLAKIIYDVPMDIRAEDCLITEPDTGTLLRLFKELEFTSLLQHISSGAHKISMELLTEPTDIKRIISGTKDIISFDVETTGTDAVDAEIVGISFCLNKGSGYYIPVGHTCITDITQPDLREVIGIIRPILEDPSISKVGHNLKYDIICFRKYDVTVRGRIFDTMVASYLLNPNKSTHNLEATVLDHIGSKKKGYKEVAGKIKNFSELDIETAGQYSAEDAAFSFALKEILFDKLENDGLLHVYDNMEEPLINVLVDIELAGVKVDIAKLKKYSASISKEIRGIRDEIYGLAGREFNINSPKQLGEVLFNEIGLRPIKKTKSGYSTDISVLEELSLEHDLPKEILEYRSLSKIKNTYLDTLQELTSSSTGRVHTSFNQTVTATGRLSSSEPNLQNIPARGEWGKKIRESFIAEDGNVIISADYSQIELRILAHMSGDKRLMTSFMEDSDIHSNTAMDVFEVSEGELTADMRRVAKAVNFGIIYGITPFGLSETLKCTPDKAKEYIDRYFSIHPGVQDFIRATIEGTRRSGHAVTLLGRKRPVPDISSKNSVRRAQAERIAVNTPIQGTAADIIKIAMINLKKRFTSESLGATIILQVHDELVVESSKRNSSAVISALRTEMESAVKLNVPLKVDISSGSNWAEAH